MVPGSRSSSWLPLDRADVTGPGTAMAIRLRSLARPRVNRAPLRRFASTSTVPRLSAAMTRLRTRNLTPVRVGAGRPFAQQQAAFGDPVEEHAMALRIRPVDAAGEHGDGDAGRGQRAAVGGGVDSEGSAGDDRPSAVGQAVAELGRDMLAVGGAGPRADDRHRLLADLAATATDPAARGTAVGRCRGAPGRLTGWLIRTRSSSWAGHSSSSGVTMRAPILAARSSARSARRTGSTSARRPETACRS